MSRAGRTAPPAGAARREPDTGAGGSPGRERGRTGRVDASDIGRFLLVAAVVLAVAGVVLLVASALGLGRLPGDLSFGRGNTRVYVPLATSIVLSVVATVVLNLLLRR